MAEQPYRLTATQAIQAISSGALTVEGYARSLLARIAARDAAVQAWAYLDAEYVLSQARQLDKVPAEKRGPLHGVAIGVKDVILTKDMPTCHNSPIYEGSPPGHVDAACIITLRAAGALIFGKTTTAEFAATRVGPKTRNPHDPDRTPGGSSTGSGAAVADFQVPITLGTQTGGSMIRPGSFNGVYALKPTWGAISREGLTQYSVTCDTLGIYARSVEDLELVSQVFQLADDEPVPSQPFAIKGAKIAFCQTPAWPKAGPGTKGAWVTAQDILRQRGAEIEEIELPDEFAKIRDWHANVLAGEGRTSFLGNFLLAKEKMHQSLLDHVQNASQLSRKAQLESYDGCARLRPVWDELASRYDAVIAPSVVDEAPLGIEDTGDAAFCSMWTILQVPCLNMPGFAGEHGLPVGLTLVGGRYHDLHVLHAGEAVGGAFAAEGGFVSKLP